MSVDGKQDHRSPPDQSGGAQSPINLIDDVQSGQDSESDAPVSASEWPPSPQGPQLPPDSSMESADGHQTPDLQSRKSSFVPVVSQNHRHDRHSRATGSPDHRPLSESRASSAIPIAATPSKTNAGPLRKDDLDSTVDDFNKDHSTQLRNLSSRPSEVYEQGPHDFALGPDHSAFSESPFDLVNRAEHHKKSFNSYSIPSSPASDLEMVIPIPLDNEATHQIFPSTASQPAEPFTQVKRTPYVNGQIYKYPAPGPNRLQSPPHTNSPRLRANGTPIDEVDHVTQSTPFMIETSSSEALPNKAKEGTVIEDVPTDILHADSDMTGTHQKERHPTQSPGHLPERLVKPSEAEKPLPASVIEEKGNFSLPASIPICNRGYDELETKRKASDLDTLSPNVGKRRKRFKVPEALDNIEDLGQRPDPTEGARRFRQDFLASRMVGVPITPQESATTTSASISHIANANVKLSTIGNSEQQATMNLEKHLSPQKGSHLMDVDLESPTNATKGAEPTVPRPGHNAEDDRSNLTADPSSLPGAQDAAPGAQENDGSEVEINGPNKGTNLLGSIDLDKMEQNFFQTERSLGAITASSMPSPHRIQGVETDKYWPQFVTQGASTSGDTPLQGNDFIGIAQSTPTGSTFLDPLLVLDRTPQQTSQPASRLSKKAVSPDISIEKSGVREIRATVPKPLTKSMPAQEPRTLFEKFKITYSAYPGDQKHFIAICKKIQTLLSNDRMEHQSLWDDFIVRHKVEYPHYVRRCAEDAEDPLRYEDFYRTEVERPLYQEGLVTRKTLLEVLSLGDQEKVASEGHDQRKSDIRGKPARSLFEPGKFSFQDQRPFKPASVIDVSGKEGRAIDHKPSDTRSLLNSTNRTKIVSTKGTRRSLPWVDQKGSIKNSNSLESVKSHSLGLPNLGSDRRQRDDHTARELSRSRGPSPLPPTTTAVESRQGSQAGPWWTDENTPFKAFANAYSSIRHGSGNSYAKEKPPTVPNSDSRMRRKTAEVKRVIDPLNWEL